MRRFLVVGTGRAGQARMRGLAVRPGIEGVALGARESEFQSQLTQYLSDPAVEAVLVCTDNASHFEIARQALAAGKHVLVEFPLTHSPEHAMTLNALAQSQSRVLHVEFIGLMTNSHLAYKAMDTRAWQRVVLTMQGGFYRWVQSEYEANRIGGLMNGRLQALHHLLGGLKVLKTDVQRWSDGYGVSVELTDHKLTQIEIRDTRRIGLKRVRQMEVFDASGALITPEKRAGRRSLFDADLEVFCQKIEQQNIEWSLPTYPDILEVIRLSEAISHQCVSTLGENALHRG